MRYSRHGRRDGGRDWSLLSRHGSILFYIAANPDTTVKDLAEDFSLTRRTIWSVIGDLRGEGMLHVRKSGRRNHYLVNLEAPFHHPTIGGYSLRHVLGRLTRQARRDGALATEP